MQRLLPNLPPIQLPTPLPYSVWKEQLMDSLPKCRRCDNSRKLHCPECDGEGAAECCECGHENDCDTCSGTGYIECKCTGGTSNYAYIQQVTKDYQLLLRHRSFVMPDHEIANLARQNATH